MLLDSLLPIQLEIVDISKTKEGNDKTLFFEMDVIIQMMHLLNIEDVEDISVEVNSIDIDEEEKQGTSSLTYTLPISFCEEFTDDLNRIGKISDIIKKAELLEAMIVKYAIKSNNASFFNKLWGNKRYATSRFVFIIRNREPLIVGPFKMIDLVRSFDK